MTAEVWLPVVGWEGLYEVSSHGRLRSCDRIIVEKSGKSRKQAGRMCRSWLQQGYPTFALQDKASGKYRRTYVHRFVCEAFHGPAPTVAHEVAHNDGNPGNCHEDNLRWATHAENEADKLTHGSHLHGERHFNAKLTAEQVREIRASSERGCDLAARFGVSRPHISIIRKGRTWREPAMAGA